MRIQYPEDLPISARRAEILSALRESQVVVVAGETGSGKTTQLPKMCIEAGFAERGRIGCTQPRRVAAMSVSRRVAEELGVAWGREVGCKMRFNDDTSRDTRLKFMTDGILLAEIQSDPMLRSYSALILDEAHERSLNIDFLLGYLKTLLTKRPDLKLVITSATIDTAAFSAAFGGAPVIEVSGRTWPVEIRYAPVDDSWDGEGFVDAAVRTVEEVLIESDDGDVLVFMPTERDIREARDLLEGRLGSGYEVLTLFGRMAGADQQRVFSPGRKRRVIVATNVAETSLTLPRIHAVVDTGLARMSRYNPRTRTKRLPVEPVAQSSANQRAGRAGRVRDGLCIRLYSEEDYQKRPAFTQPEIQRANLAEVILRMKAFRLGDIAEFPFLNPPTPAAIRAGYDLLHELGALNDTDEMTDLGRELARLPVDPTLGRMLLQARVEKALPEVLVIAAGLSIPDPRERPEEAREKAAQAHRAFVSKDSDFMTLLRIWRAAHEADNGNGGNALRRFCKANWLSWMRMREWRDLHRQLMDSMSDDEDARVPPLSRESNDDAVHRSILAGHPSHIARREGPNAYKTSRNREVMLFPGSGLHERRERKGKPTGAVEEKTKQAQWIVAAEIVQTSQLFARTVARIQPEWVVQVAEHLCEFRASEPAWNAKAGRVLALERTLIYGLEVRRRQIDYGRVDPQGATDLFIRAALVDGDSDVQHRFLTENRKLCDRLKAAQARVRAGRVFGVEEALYRFYAARISGVSSVHDLNRLVKAKHASEPDFLIAREEDLTDGTGTGADLALFPEQVKVANSVLPVSYAWQPGEEHDGVTVQVPLPMAEHLRGAQVQWMVPGLREEMVGLLLRALPKTARRVLLPMEDRVREVCEEFRPGTGDFLPELAHFLCRRYRIDITEADWPAGVIPAHLRPRVEVIDRERKAVATGRDLAEIRAAVKSRDERSKGWERAAARWEKPAVTAWSFGDLPESIIVEEIGDLPVYAWPGLEQDAKTGTVSVRLYKEAEAVLTNAPAAIRALAETALARDIAWLTRELRTLSPPVPASKKPGGFLDALQQVSAKLQTTAGTAFTAPVLQATALEHILTHALRLEPVLPLTEKRFTTLTESARRDFPALARRVRELTRDILTLHTRLLHAEKRYTGMDTDLARLVPPDFLARTPHTRLPHLIRYLRAIEMRGERAVLQPAKDVEKAWNLSAFAGWSRRVRPENRETVRWMLEELRVQLFAQELGTAQPVSAKRIEALLEPVE